MHLKHSQASANLHFKFQVWPLLWSWSQLQALKVATTDFPLIMQIDVTDFSSLSALYRPVVRQKAASVSTKTLSATWRERQMFRLYVAAFDDEEDNTLASGNVLTIQKYHEFKNQWVSFSYKCAVRQKMIFFPWQLTTATHTALLVLLQLREAVIVSYRIMSWGVTRKHFTVACGGLLEWRGKASFSPVYNAQFLVLKAYGAPYILHF